MKTCVFITGTNAVGKTTLVKELIARYGGIKESTKTITTCNDSKVCFAGHYGDGKFGGVDGFNQTKCLEGVVREGLASHEAIICDLTNAAFAADRQLLVFLYCPVEEIHKRLLDRAGKGLTNDAVWKKQLNCATAARKWASIGVPVLSFDTSKTTTQEIADTVTAKIDALCG